MSTLANTEMERSSSRAAPSLAVFSASLDAVARRSFPTREAAPMLPMSCDCHYSIETIQMSGRR
jgi:hypothetical protein